MFDQQILVSVLEDVVMSVSEQVVRTGQFPERVSIKFEDLKAIVGYVAELEENAR